MTSDIHDMLARTLRVQSYSGVTSGMDAFIHAELAKMHATVRYEKRITYAVVGPEGQPSPSFMPAIVAHTDTVHHLIKDRHYQVRESKDGVFYAVNTATKRYTGVGGDDKAGIAIALHVASVRQKQNLSTKLCFVPDEEIGCRGSEIADLTFFDDCAFILQADRRGNDDFVRVCSGVELHGADFANAVAPIRGAYGYKDCEYGVMTDVLELTTRGVGIATANMSAGYYRPHSAEECVWLEDVQNCADMTLAICANLGNARWTFAQPVYERMDCPRCGAWMSWAEQRDGFCWTCEMMDYRRSLMQKVRANVLSEANPGANVTPITIDTTGANEY